MLIAVTVRSSHTVYMRNARVFRAVDVLTGFLDGNGHAQGWSIGVAIANDGTLLVADDVGNTVWRLTAGATPKS